MSCEQIHEVCSLPFAPVAVYFHNYCWPTCMHIMHPSLTAHLPPIIHPPPGTGTQMMLEHDQLAEESSAKNVLRHLRAGAAGIPVQRQTELLQAYVRALNTRGHYCRLLTVDARTMRVLILQQAEKKYD
eukprot:2041541-Pleurochrysis_carterae.AAC.1